MMAKYEPLRQHLEGLQTDEVTLSFDEIERMVGGLPPSAYEHRAWWANTRSHPNAVAWLDAGWELTDVKFGSQHVRFRRVGPPAIEAETGVDQSPTRRAPKTPKGGRRRPVDRRQRILTVISEFGDLLDYYDAQLPFDRSGQYANHRKTIDLRQNAGTVTAALADERFLQALYATLQSWGIGSRASTLVPFSDFVTALRQWSGPLTDLDQRAIDQPTLDVDATGQELWRLIEGIHVVENQARLVALSKTLHHLLPDLLPPIDRMYTQEFFGFHSPEFQYGQQGVFTEIWTHYVEIAKAVDPASYVGSGWRTSRSKVIDNAIVAVVHRERRSPD
jgi:hypothetical protein